MNKEVKETAPLVIRYRYVYIYREKLNTKQNKGLLYNIFDNTGYKDLAGLAYTF